MDTYAICSQICPKTFYNQSLGLGNNADTGCKNKNNKKY